MAQIYLENTSKINLYIHLNHIDLRVACYNDHHVITGFTTATTESPVNDFPIFTRSTGRQYQGRRSRGEGWAGGL